MWGYFSRGPDFPYTLGELQQSNENSLWTMHKAKKKRTGEEVSIFTYDSKTSSPGSMELAKASLKRLKTLRHPCILPYCDGFESDDRVCVVTEPVVPLEAWLRDNEENRQQSIAWGLHQISKALSFIIEDVGLLHNAVCMGAVYVDVAGEWRLGGLDYSYSPKDESAPVKIHSILKKYEPPESSRTVSMNHPWSADMWGLGCLVWECFNGPLDDISRLKSLASLPRPLVTSYASLMNAQPAQRPKPRQFVEDCRASGRFMHNTYVDAMLFLEQIQIKDPGEKQQFFSDLTKSLDTFPKQSCRYRILPKLLDAFEFANAGAFVLPPLLKLGKSLDADEYQKKIIPCVVKMFESPDRNTRVKLLQQIDSFVNFLNASVVNDQIFPNIVKGFIDTNPVVREYTIKSMLYLAPKLNYKNLNEEVLRQFARLQLKDDQGGIRTNTTICLGKIAYFLNPQTRQKILLSGMQRALKDPFAAARQAAVQAILSTNRMFTLTEIANRVLPMLATCTVDQDKAVRDQAFTAIQCFIDKLTRVSEDPSLREQEERDVLTGGGGASAMGGASAVAAGWAGWAVGGVSTITSILRNKPATVDKDCKKDGVPSTTANPSASGSSTGNIGSNVASTTTSNTSRTTTGPSPTSSHAPSKSTMDQGNPMSSRTSPPASTTKITVQAGKATNQQSNWDDWASLDDQLDEIADSADCGVENFQDEDQDDWGSLEPDSCANSTSNVGNTGSSDPTKTSTAMKSTTTSVKSTTKTTTASDWSNDNEGWTDNWGDVSLENHSRIEKEAKKAERQRKMEQKRNDRKLKSRDGAMKLGVKKTSF